MRLVDFLDERLDYFFEFGAVSRRPPLLLFFKIECFVVLELVLEKELLLFRDEL